MKIFSATFTKSVIKPNDFPKEKFPEFAFLGRSNVGKSSLINMLVSQRKLVKTGGRPGMTKAINYFLINKSFYFVDFPGFGYAKVPREIKKSFYPLMLKYIKSNRNVRIAFVLIDCRRIPEEAEKDIITILSKYNIPTAIVITKCDKLSNSQLSSQLNEIASQLSIDKKDLFISSTKNGKGKKELLQIISSYLTPI